MVPCYLVNFDSKETETHISDVLVIGSGIAGLTAALDISKDLEVTLIAKDKLEETSTWYAQGGVATAISETDSPELHLKDTLKVGVGLCKRGAVDVLVNEAAQCIDWLVRLGTEFDLLGRRLKLAREGGHSLPRIVHSGDTTGAEIENTLARAAKRWRSAKICEHTFLVDLLTHERRCVGAIVFDVQQKKFMLEFAPVTILATGGCGQLFEVTTNPPVTTGDGVALAYRAGAEISDMEFIQFHPTALDKQEFPRFLITEALRGEGAYLRDSGGKRFLKDAHPLAELAPRDIVVREIVKVLAVSGEGHVYLDATDISKDKLKEDFPNIWQKCKEFGYDLAKDSIPVIPAAHYMIGGVKTDINGKTNLPGLYASGEVAATGVHGANRLASNSLLEGLVFSKRIARQIKDRTSKIQKTRKSLEKLKLSHREKKAKSSNINITQARKHLCKLMTESVGVIRTKKELQQTLKEFDKIGKVLNSQFSNVAGFELQNMILTGKLMAEAALRREESRGTHYREDFPKVNNKKWRKHIIFGR